MQQKLKQKQIKQNSDDNSETLRCELCKITQN